MNTRDAIRAMMDKNRVVGNYFEDKLKFVYFDGEIFRDNEHRDLDINCISSDEWKLYEEPKKTKIIYQWRIKLDYCNSWYIEDKLFTEEELRYEFTDYESCVKTGVQFEVEA